MKSYSELLDMQTRGEDVTPNPNNKVTRKRQAAANYIAKESNGNGEDAYNISMDMLGDNVTRLQEFVLSHSEEPAPDLRDLAKQVYQLRMTDVSEAGEILDLDTEESKTFLEEQEASFEGDFGYVADDFLGHLGAPLEIAVGYMQGKKEGFVDPGLITGIINTVGSKLNHGELVRAAQGKSANFITGLSTGGKAHYNSLVAYFKAHPDTAKQVTSGQITDESQLPGWTAPATTAPLYNNPLNNIATDTVNSQFKRAIPYIILFLVLIGVIVYVAARHKK